MKNELFFLVALASIAMPSYALQVTPSFVSQSMYPNENRTINITLFNDNIDTLVAILATNSSADMTCLLGNGQINNTIIMAGQTYYTEHLFLKALSDSTLGAKNCTVALTYELFVPSSPTGGFPNSPSYDGGFRYGNYVFVPKIHVINNTNTTANTAETKIVFLEVQNASTENISLNATIPSSGENESSEVIEGRVIYPNSVMYFWVYSWELNNQIWHYLLGLIGLGA
jgi:hypothetical protein